MLISRFHRWNRYYWYDSLSYSDLTISQGTGDYANHTIVSKTSSGEYLAIVQNTNLSNYVLDIVSTSTDAQTLTGTAGDDVLGGGLKCYSSSGLIYCYLRWNDTITVNGVVIKL